MFAATRRDALPGAALKTAIGRTASETFDLARVSAGAAVYRLTP
jgi:hypothetical protein